MTNSVVTGSLRSVLLCTCLVLGIAGRASGAELLVPAEHATITAALAAASAGDSVLVSAGIYSASTNAESFPLTLSSDITLLGDGWPVTTLDAEGSGSVFLVSGGSGVIRGFRVTGGVADRGGGAQILAGTPEIADCLFVANGALLRGSGINVQGSAAPWIHHNVVWQSYDTNLSHGGDPHGIQLAGSSTGLVENNLVGRGDSNGLLVGENSAPTIRHNIFYENGIPGVRGRGICSLGDPATVIAHNLFFGNQIAAIIMPNPSGGFVNLSGQAASDFDSLDSVYGNIDGDPLLLNPGLERFEITSASPAIDAGEAGVGVDPDGTPLDLGPFYFSQVVAAPPSIAWAASLLANVPNPFNPRTSIRFRVDRESRISLDVFDTRGRRVRSGPVGVYGRGQHEWIWDGTDDRGTALASGVYRVRLMSLSGASMRPIALVR